MELRIHCQLGRNEGSYSEAGSHMEEGRGGEREEGEGGGEGVREGRPNGVCMCDS